MYGAKSEGWLDKSLAAAKQLQEQTPPRPTEDEDIVLQVRRGLRHAKDGQAQGLARGKAAAGYQGVGDETPPGHPRVPRVAP
jgi:hypothetical protein